MITTLLRSMVIGLKQLYLAQAMPNCGTVLDEVPSNANLHHNQDRKQTTTHPRIFQKHM